MKIKHLSYLGYLFYPFPWEKHRIFLLQSVKDLSKQKPKREQYSLKNL